jgi:regulator of protease activity HflC (stomatin/prohibitin superfamily)
MRKKTAHTPSLPPPESEVQINNHKTKKCGFSERHSLAALHPRLKTLLQFDLHFVGITPNLSQHSLLSKGPKVMITIAGSTVAAIIFAVFVIITLMACIRQVPQGYHYTVERFRKYNRTLMPGLGLVIPYVETVGHKVNVMEQVLDVPTQEVITRDNAAVTVDGVVFYQVLDAPRASYEVSNLHQALMNLVMTNIRTVMGSMELDQLLSNRDEINSKLLHIVDAAVSPWGIKATRIEIKDIVPPRDLADAMARQMKAERDRRAAILEAEGMKQAAILKSEGNKQSQILEAEGRREAAFRDAEARERGAQAEAEATRMVSEAIAKGTMGAVNYLVAEKYIKALDNLSQSPNQKVLLLPTEMAGLGGVLAGIAEIAKSATGEQPSNTRSKPKLQSTDPRVTMVNADGSQTELAGPWGKLKG